MQWRNRTCDSPAPSGYGQDCEGHEREGRQCNTDSCQGTWSCWSPFTPCTVTCGSGVKSRSRHCESSKVGGIPCFGNSVESRLCVMETCPTETVTSPPSVEFRDQDLCIGWTWSDWSPCIQHSGVQYRHRSPPRGQLFPVPACSQRLEMRSCEVITSHVIASTEGTSDVNVGAVKSAGSSSSSHTRRLGVLYLVITAIISFIIGGVACIGLYLYIQHHRKQQRKEEALWTTDNLYSENLGSNVPVSDNYSNLPKMNNLSSSQDSLEMRMLNNLSEMSQYDAFGSLRKGKVTVNEASTLKRNSMWTNLSINDDKY